MIWLNHFSMFQLRDFSHIVLEFFLLNQTLNLIIIFIMGLNFIFI